MTSWLVRDYAYRSRTIDIGSRSDICQQETGYNVFEGTGYIHSMLALTCLQS